MDRRTVLTVCVGFLTIHIVNGQPKWPPDDRRIERVEQFRKVRLIEVLELKEEQSVRFFARLNEHEKARRELLAAKDEVLNKIERSIRNRADEKDIETLFGDVADADAKVAAENKRFFDSLTDILSTEQRGKLLLFERHFARELREAMRDAQRRRHQPGEL